MPSRPSSPQCHRFASYIDAKLQSPSYIHANLPLTERMVLLKAFQSESASPIQNLPTLTDIWYISALVHVKMFGNM